MAIKKVAVVDDSDLMREVLEYLLIDHGFDMVFTAPSGFECLEKLHGGFKPEIVIIDFMMPGLNGYETILEANKHFPGMSFVLFTMFDIDIPTPLPNLWCIPKISTGFEFVEILKNLKDIPQKVSSNSIDYLPVDPKKKL